MPVTERTHGPLLFRIKGSSTKEPMQAVPKFALLAIARTSRGACVEPDNDIHGSAGSDRERIRDNGGDDEIRRGRRDVRYQEQAEPGVVDGQDFISKRVQADIAKVPGACDSRYNDRRRCQRCTKSETDDTAPARAGIPAGTSDVERRIRRHRTVPGVIIAEADVIADFRSIGIKGWIEKTRITPQKCVDNGDQTGIEGGD